MKITRPIAQPARRIATIDDVARVTGYSTATISRVINKSPKVAQKNAAAGRDCDQDLGYVPDHAARMLASNSSRTIGIVVPAIENMSYATRSMRCSRGCASSATRPDLHPRMTWSLSWKKCRRWSLRRGRHCAGRRHPQAGADRAAEGARSRRGELVISNEHPCVGFDNRAAGSALLRTWSTWAIPTSR